MSSIVLSSEMMFWIVMFVGSVVMTILIAQSVPDSVEQSGENETTMLGWIELFTFMLIFLWMVVSLVAVVVVGFAEVLAFVF